MAIKLAGGLYDGVDLSINDLLMHRITYENGLTLRSEVDKEGKLRFRVGFLTPIGGGNGGGMSPEEVFKHVKEAVEELGTVLHSRLAKFKVGFTEHYERWAKRIEESLETNAEELKK